MMESRHKAAWLWIRPGISMESLRSGGAHGNGTVFEYNSSGYTVLYSFQSGTGDGQYPQGGLTIDDSGSSPILYGTGSLGGTNDAGVIFKMTVSGGTWSETVLYSFAGDSTLNENDNGGNPIATMCLASDGYLYGTAYTGGGYDLGVAFQYGPSNGRFLKICSFPDASPYYNGLTEGRGQ